MELQWHMPVIDNKWIKDRDNINKLFFLAQENVFNICNSHMAIYPELKELWQKVDETDLSNWSDLYHFNIRQQVPLIFRKHIEEQKLFNFRINSIERYKKYNKAVRSTIFELQNLMAFSYLTYFQKLYT